MIHDPNSRLQIVAQGYKFLNGTEKSKQGNIWSYGPIMKQYVYNNCNANFQGKIKYSGYTMVKILYHDYF